MSFIKRILKTMGILTLSEIITKISLLISLPLLTRLLGPYQYGLYSQANVLAAFLSPIMIIGLDNGILRHYSALDLTERKKYVVNAGYLLITMTLLTLFIVISAKDFIQVTLFKSTAIALSFFVYYGFMYATTTCLLGYLKSITRARNEVRLYASISIMQAVMRAIIIGGLYVIKVDVQILLLSLIISDILTILIFFFALKLELWRNRKLVRLTKMLHILKYGFVLIPMAYAMWGINSIDRVIMARYLDVDTIGIYSFNYSVAALGVQLILAPIYFSFPMKIVKLFEEKLYSDARTLFKKHIILSTGAILLVTLPVMSTYKFVVNLAFGSDYLMDISIIMCIIFAYLFSYLASYLDVVASLFFRHYYSSIAISIALVCNVFLNFILIPRYGAIGASTATLAAFLVQFFLMAVLVYRLLIDFKADN